MKHPDGYSTWPVSFKILWIKNRLNYLNKLEAFIKFIKLPRWLGY